MGQPPHELEVGVVMVLLAIEGEIFFRHTAFLSYRGDSRVRREISLF